MHIYSATFLPNTVKIGQHLTSLLWKSKGWTFWKQCISS